LNSYLLILLFTLRGSFANEQGGTHLPIPLVPILGRSGAAERVDENGVEQNFETLPVSGARILAGLTPGNSIADEILTDHPDRFRAMIVESSNPAHSVADSKRFREAMDALDLVVVIEIAMTETARQADYVLPACSQYEKLEATYFNFQHPHNFYHLRKPLFSPREGTLAEPEMHARLVEALNVFDPGELDDLREAAKDRETFSQVFFDTVASNPKIADYVPYVLYRTLGPTLEEGAAAAILWLFSHQYALEYADIVTAAGFDGEGFEAGEKLFEAILKTPTGVIISKDEPGNPKYQFRLATGKVRLDMAEMFTELEKLGQYWIPEGGDLYPMILAAGERRAYTANTCIRDPEWMKGKDSTQLSIHPIDAKTLQIADGQRARLVTKYGSAEVDVQFSDRMRQGTLSIPNGVGLEYPNESGEVVATGVAPNELTGTAECDPYAKTPWHKYVHARVEPIGL
jgi:anaerobic selenocysteine-containing dehydrogenase